MEASTASPKTAWGETEAKDVYSHTNYKHAIAVGDQLKLIAYCPKDLADYWDSSIKPDGPDRVLQLNPSDDAAHIHLGGSWRIPTKDEFQALVSVTEVIPVVADVLFFDTNMTNVNGSKRYCGCSICPVWSE